MGCVSSAFLEDDDSIVGPTLGDHIVSLTSTTYGLLTTLDHPSPKTPTPPPTPPPPPLPSSSPLPPPLRSEPEVINSWELMAGLDPITPTKSPITPLTPTISGKENSQRSLISLHFPNPTRKSNILRPSNGPVVRPNACYSLEMFEKRCPPGGEHSAVLYTTTLRGVRKTFEDCNAVRAAMEGLGVWIKERDVSMDLGFREELRDLMKGSREGATVPRVFVKGRYIGGAEMVLRIHEEGGLAGLLEGLPKARGGGAPCDGCGGVRFLPCVRCSGSKKVVEEGRVGRCSDCNENGLVVCPICS